MHRSRFSLRKGSGAQACLVSTVILAFVLAAAPAAEAASLITSVQLTAEARGSIPARPAPWAICRGEVLHVVVATQHPNGPGHRVAVAIDGIVGNQRFFQFFGDSGPRHITVTAETEQGDLETVTKEILVDSCTVNDLPQVRGRVNPYHAGFVDFQVSGGNFGPDFLAYQWDFGDGASAGTAETFVSHDFSAVLDGTAPYHSLIVQVSDQPIVGGVPASGSLVRRYALTMMDSYWFSKRKGILQPPVTTSATMEARGHQLVGSYTLRNLEAEAIVFQYAELEELNCEPGAPSRRRQVLPSDVVFQGGYGFDPDDPDFQQDPGFQAAMELKESISWLPEDAWVVPPLVDPAKPKGGKKTATTHSGVSAQASSATAQPVFPPIPPPPGAESGFVVVPALHTHEGYLTLKAGSLDAKTCSVAFHMVGETLSGQRAYASLYYETQENPTLVAKVTDKPLAAFLKKLLDRGLVSDPTFVSHEDLYRLEQEGKIRRTAAGWEVI